MKCYVCGKQPMKDNVTMFPVDGAGTPGRRWACLEHSDLSKVPKDVLEISSIFDELVKEKYSIK